MFQCRGLPVITLCLGLFLINQQSCKHYSAIKTRYDFTCGAGEDNPYKLDVFEDFLYVTMQHTHDILKLEKFGPDAPGGKPRSLLVKGNMRIGDIVIVQKYKQKDMSTSREFTTLSYFLAAAQKNYPLWGVVNVLMRHLICYLQRLCRK